MLRHNFLILITIILGSSLGHATSFMGAANLMNQKFNAPVSVAGTLTAQNATFTSVSVAGSANIIQSQMTSLNVEGALSLMQTQVMGPMTVAGGADLTEARVMGFATIEGSLSATQSAFMHGVTVEGGAHLQGVTLEGPVTIEGGAVFTKVKAPYTPLVIEGPLHSTDSTLGDISIAGRKSVLSGGSVGNITVQKDNANNISHKIAHFFSSLIGRDEETAERQVIYLKDDIKITGTITFKGKKGIVYTSAPQLLQGKVSGGEVKSL